MMTGSWLWAAGVALLTLGAFGVGLTWGILLAHGPYVRWMRDLRARFAADVREHAAKLARREDLTVTRPPTLDYRKLQESCRKVDS